ATATAAAVADRFLTLTAEGGATLGGRLLDVEADVQHVAVLDHVGLPLEALLAPLHDLGPRACLDEVVPTDHLAADEPSCDIGVDRRHGIELHDLVTLLLIAGFRLLPDAFEPSLDVVAIGDQQLELKRNEVVIRISRPRPGVEDDE